MMTKSEVEEKGVFIQPGDPFGNGNTKRSARNLPLPFEWDAYRFEKESALAGDNFQLIICEGTFIDRYRLVGGIISL